MYVDISLKLTPEQVKRLSSGLAVRITKAHTGTMGAAYGPKGPIGSEIPLSVTATQMKKIQNIARGTQGYMLLKLSAPALKRTVQQHGGSFFGKIGKFFKKTFTTPSGILGVASMIPTPLSGVLKVASTATKLAGHGAKPRPKKLKGRGAKLFNVDEFNRSSDSAMYHVPELNTEENRIRAIEDTLTGMGFRAHHIQHMRGSGVFSSLWKGAKKLGTLLKPYIKKQGTRLIKEYGPDLAKNAAQFAIKKFLGGANSKPAYRGPSRPPRKYVVNFTKPQTTYIQKQMVGDGVFSDIADTLKEYIPKAVKAAKVGAKKVASAAKSVDAKRKQFLQRLTASHGGNLTTLGSVRY